MEKLQMNLSDLINLASIGGMNSGMNEGLSNSMDGFMNIIHGMNDFSNWIYGGYIDFTNGIKALGGLFGG
jgi:hypothetical protein